MGLFKKIKEKHEERKAEGKTIGDKLKNAVKKIGGDVRYAPILPFKPMMVKALNKANVSHTNDISDIAAKFHSNVVLGTHFDKSNYNYTLDERNDFNLAVDVVAGIVSAIINWIKSIKQKKASGQPLSSLESAALQDANAAAAQTLNSNGEVVLKAGQMSGAAGVKAFIFSVKGALVLAGIIAIVLIATHKK